MKKWNKLDNVAILFPATIHKAETQVFRLSCELQEVVDCDLLQQALDETMLNFEAYRYVLKRGLFWYYLEESEIKPKVEAEQRQVCGPLYQKGKKMLLFEVSYFKNLINLEVYHVLSDGTGAVLFFQNLVAAYLLLKKSEEIEGMEEVSESVPSRSQMVDNSFAKYYNGDTLKMKRSIDAIKLSGHRYSGNRLKVITGHVSATEVYRQAKHHNTTVTGYLCGCLMKAIADEVPVKARRKPLVISVPVNLRKYFSSESIRNFFNTVLIPYDLYQNSMELQNIIHSVDEVLKEKVTLENLAEGMNNYISIEKKWAVKIVPLLIKDIVLKFAYLKTQKNNTAVFSNLGIIKMSDKFKEDICAFNICASTNKMQLSLCTYEDVLSIGITTPLINPEIQRRFFQLLTMEGIHVEIASNIAEEGEIL